MADDGNENEIRQEMLLDASATLASLTQVDTAFTQLSTRLNEVSASFETFNTRADATVASLKQMAAAAAQTFSSMKGLNAQFNPTVAAPKSFKPAAADPRDLGAIQNSMQDAVEAGRAGKSIIEEADRTTRNWMLSWQTLSRVIQTQIIVRTLNLIRDAFEEAYQSNIKFASEVSEIRAVDPGRSFEQIAANVRALSDAFNQPLAQVAEAQYQAISNQFVKISEQANILTAANQLAKVTVQDLGTAVTLITGSLNAYGESSEMAGMRAAQFFEAVALGHFRLNDLSTALGRNQTIGHELGVEMEELEASMITLSIGGLKANEAATQLRGVMSALLKPSQNMREALHSLGIESGEEAIATWGLMGTLQHLESAAHGSASAMAALFPNVRGLAGVLRIANEGAEKYAESLDRLYAAADQSKLKTSFAEFMATDAQKATAELNKLHNYLTTEFGADLVHEMAALTGGTDTLIALIRPLAQDLLALGPALVGAAGAFLGLGRSMAFVAGEAGAARTSMSELQAMMANPVKTVAIGLALIEGARMLGSAIGEIYYNAQTTEARAAQKVMDEEAEHRKRGTDFAIREEERKNKALVQSLRQYMAEANKEHLQHQDTIKESMKVEEQVMKIAFDRIMEDRRRLTEELRSISEKAGREAAEVIPQKQEDIQRRKEDRALAEQASGRSLAQQYQQYEIAERRKLAAAEKLQAGAMDEAGEKRAEAAWKQAEAYQQQRTAIAEQMGDADKLRAVNDSLWEIDNRRLRALDAQANAERKLSKEADTRLHTAEEHDLVLEEQRRKIEEVLKATTKDDKGAIRFKTPEQIEANLDTARGLIATFQETYKSFGSDFSEKFLAAPDAFKDLSRKAEEAAASFNMQAVGLAPDKIQGFFDSLKSEAKKLQLEIPVIAKIAQVVGMDLASSSLHQVLGEAQKQADQGAAAEKTRERLQADEGEARQKYWEARQRIGTGTINEYHYEELDRLAKRKMTDTDWQGFQENLKYEQEELHSGRRQMGAAESADYATMIHALGQMRSSQTAMPEVPKNQEELQGALWEAKGWTEMQSGMEKLSSSVDALQEAIKANTTAAEKFSVTTPPSTHCFGGFPKQFDFGGRGTDTIPAMLSPGEMVINAVSARQFSAQLIAMNAGIQPVFRSSGGQTTNIGDVNVTVNGGESSRQTARSIATELRRELRRGISTL